MSWMQQTWLGVQVCRCAAVYRGVYRDVYRGVYRGLCKGVYRGVYRAWRWGTRWWVEGGEGSCVGWWRWPGGCEEQSFNRASA